LYPTPVPPPPARRGALPELGLVIPTLRPLATITVTVVLSVTAIIAPVQTLQAGLSTPVAAVATASAAYSWASGEALATSWTIWMEPAMDWLAILNPLNWTFVGGPLWALAPLLVPLLPIVATRLIVVFIRFALWFGSWCLKLLDVLFKLIELIPGE
jgi:hypothetical protein